MSEDVLAIPLAERVARVREVISLLNKVPSRHGRHSTINKKTMTTSLVWLFVAAYDGKKVSVRTNSCFFRAIEEQPRVLEVLGALIHLTPEQMRYVEWHQNWKNQAEGANSDSVNG